MAAKKDKYGMIFDPSTENYNPDAPDEAEDPDDGNEGSAELVDDYEKHIFDPSYEEIYDMDGNSAYLECDLCGEWVKFKNGEYVCPNCGKVYSRDEVFNAVGLDPLGPMCPTCSSKFPGCSFCPYGYGVDDTF